MKKILDYSEFTRTASRGLDAGASMHSAMTMKWDVSGRCENSVFRTITARPRPIGMKPWQHTATASDARREIELDVRCGKCGPCLRHRAARWRHRAIAECATTKGRTWFVTLTLSPENHFMMMLRASARLDARLSEEFDAMSKDKQFAARHNEIGKELTLWLKRVRKESGLPLRYCLVAEAHKSGLPHYHALVHEGSETPLPASILRKQWKLGFSRCKLVAKDEEGRKAAYVAKYLAKSAIARVRASAGYGQQSQNNMSSDIVEATRRRETPPALPMHEHDDAIAPRSTPPVRHMVAIQ